MQDLKLILAGPSAAVLVALAVSSLRKPGTGPEEPEAWAPRNRRRARDLYKLPRSAALSHLYHAAEAVSPATFPPVSFFAPRAFLRWIRNYLAYVFRPKHSFPPYTFSPRSAMYELRDENGSDNVRVAVAGDWGTGTEEAERVAEQMKRFKPHFTIHIGDVYYVGDPPEVNENCLGIRNPSNNYAPVTWPVGSQGSFAMNGNHEMYANGGGYFDLFLPRLGLCEGGKMTGQQTSFFCLQNEHWRIIAIDTGYNSVGIPILEQIPLVNRIPGVGGDCRLHDDLMHWLRLVVFKDPPDGRGLVIMSHQQYYSGFEDEFLKPAQQLREAGIQRPVLWFWGHEHRLAGYDLYGSDKLKAFGRCVGHGGMPLSIADPRPGKPQPIFYDVRRGANNFGVNGHVNLSFMGPRLTATYVDLTGEEIQIEEWSADGSGAVQLVSRTKKISDPDFHA